MFETVELGNEVEKEAYKKQAVKLREELLAAQKRLAEGKFSAIVIVGGVEGAGKSHFVNLLLEWMDPRGIEVHAFGDLSDEERERPRFWRFWRELPPKGKLAVILGSWYTDPIIDRVFKRMDAAGFEVGLDSVAEFEEMLDHEGIQVIKLWMHLGKSDQKKRLKALEEDADTRWRVTKRDWEFFKRYDRFRKVSEHALMKTSTALSPWTVIEATDWRYRNLAAVRAIVKALSDRAEQEAQEAPVPKPALPKPKKVNVIRSLDFKKSLEDEEYEEKLEKHQGRLALLSRRMHEAKKSMILVFEGPDAAGKGGAIRRVTQAFDARNYRVISSAAPNDEERARPYLWRFWRHLPRLGRLTIYDRSWYGRVLVERLEGFCAPEDWRRAFAEINAFEEQLADFGIVIVKYWIAISQDEQLRRFKERQLTPYKQYKITEEDWRNRGKFDAYEAAACEMIERTSTPHAPWVPVEGNDKRWARVKVVKSAADVLEEALG